MNRLSDKMDDKTRILMTIIRELATSQVLAPATSKGHWIEENWQNSMLNKTFVHFDFSSARDSIKPGDLVLCETSGIHNFTVAIVHSVLGWGHAVLREIGSNRLCDVTNESFRKIVGLTESQLWEGDKEQFYRKVLKAFWRGNKYLYRFGGLEFNGEDEATIWVREAFGGLPKEGMVSQPFPVKMKWNKRTTIKAILANMVEQGYGTKKFDMIPDKKAERKQYDGKAD